MFCIREDPIIYEDWRIASSSYLKTKSFIRVDILLTLAITLTNLALGAITRYGVILFAWFFAGILLVVVELAIPFMQRRVLDRLLTVVGLMVVYLVTIPRAVLHDTRYLPFTIAFSILLTLKLLYVPLTTSIGELGEELLVAKVPRVQTVLDEQMRRYEGTQFQLKTPESFTSVFYSYLKAQSPIYLVPMALLMFVVFLEFFIPYGMVISQLIYIFLVIITSVLTVSLVYYWYMKLRASKVNE